jgi:hypothetical protein
MRIRYGTLLAAGLAALALPGAAGAVDAVTGASAPALPAGLADARIWVTGDGFRPGALVTISGDGITFRGMPRVVLESQRVDGMPGDGLEIAIDIAAEATPGMRDITVADSDGTSATGVGIFEVLPPATPLPPPDPPANQPPPDNNPPDNNPPDNNPPDNNPPDNNPPGNNPPGNNPPDNNPPAGGGQQGSVQVVSRASPAFAVQGEQVNLWIVGRTFNPGLQVNFSNGYVYPAYVGERAVEAEVIKNAPSEQGMADGIQYFMAIDPEAPVGDVDITVTNPDGSSATGQRLLTILAPGQAPPMNNSLDRSVTGLTGASPPALLPGRRVSLWVWGDGIAEGAQIAFSNPSITPYAAPEVVETSTSHPGFSGMRNFLQIDAAAPAGPVNITITNPNGSTFTGQGLLSVVQSGSVPGAANPPPAANPTPGAPAPGGNPAIPGQIDPCAMADAVTSIESLDYVQPAQVSAGDTVQMTIVGRGFACGASIFIPGGGLTALEAPSLVRDSLDPASPAYYQTRLVWRLQVADGAATGPRDVTVLNPNSTSKTLPGAFTIGGGGGGGGGGGCAQGGGSGAPLPALALLLVGLLTRRRRT